MVGVMTDPSNASLVTAAGGSPRIYRGAQEVGAWAAVARPDDSPALKGAVERLGRILAAGRPPRANVPRGFYFNVRV